MAAPGNINTNAVNPASKSPVRGNPDGFLGSKWCVALVITVSLIFLSGG
jgi:hypothetical protein